jgi:RNA polymerase sigma-70 factor (ECF subfamily)
MSQDAAVAAPAPAVTDERFRDLYRDEYERVARYAYRLTRDVEVARDIAQEAFTRLLTRWIAVREPRPYLFHVVTNLARDAYQQRVRATAYAQQAAAVTRDVDAPDRTVLDAISRLPARHRDVVFLHYYADLAVPDVAAAVRRPAGTVKRLLSEARARLAETLGETS